MVNVDLCRQLARTPTPSIRSPININKQGSCLAFGEGDQAVAGCAHTITPIKSYRNQRGRAVNSIPNRNEMCRQLATTLCQVCRRHLHRDTHIGGTNENRKIPNTKKKIKKTVYAPRLRSTAEAMYFQQELDGSPAQAL